MREQLEARRAGQIPPPPPSAEVTTQEAPLQSASGASESATLAEPPFEAGRTSTGAPGRSDITLDDLGLDLGDLAGSAANIDDSVLSLAQQLAEENDSPRT